MLLELLSTSNYGMYNISLANIVGLESAVYLSALIDINEKAIRKNKIDNEFFTIDRKYITSRTTLDDKKQKLIEKDLVELEILDIDKENKNKIKLNINVLTTIMMNKDETLVADISSITKKKQAKVSKQESIKIALKKNIFAKNQELIDAYENWIDAVFTLKGGMTSEAVLIGQDIVDRNSGRNLDTALEIIKTATINGWPDMSWAVNSYVRNKNTAKQGTNTNIMFTPKTTNTSEGPVKLVDEVF